MRNLMKGAVIIGSVCLLGTEAFAEEEVFGRVIPNVQHVGEMDPLKSLSGSCEPLFSPDDSVTNIINLPNSFYIKCDTLESIGAELRNLLKDPAVSSVEIFYIR
ncbi:MAG: hypothetical protein AcusKO_47700 [Acuticoccus sp.]